MNRAEKTAVVESFRDSLSRAQSVVLTEFRGLTAPEATELRQMLREAGVTLRVIKNTLAKRAIAGTDMAVVSDSLVGPTAWAYSMEDAVAPAKALVKMLKAEIKEHLSVKGGYLDGKALDAAAVEALAKLPGREELRAKLMGVFLAAGTQFVRVLAARPVEFLNLLRARANELEKDA